MRLQCRGTRWLSALLTLTLVGGGGCSSNSSSGDAGPGVPPAAPTGLQATPQDGGVTLQWSPSTDASSYDVYYSSTVPVTTSSSKQSAMTASSTVGGLSNGTGYYFAVTALNDAGASPLSTTACAVPTAANTTGLTLYDSLCGAVLDGQKWQGPGSFNMGVADGGAVMSVNMVDEASRTVRNDSYYSLASVNSNGQRVTTLQADVTVPAATASRTGGSQIRALLRLTYSPPTDRLNFPGASLNRFTADVGLIDTGSGLLAYRQFAHCDDASCATISTSGIAFTDPSGFAAIGTGLQSGSPAVYGTTYTAAVSLDEGE